MSERFAVRVDDALRSYLKDISDVLRSTEEDAERQQQITSALEEIDGKELKVATDAECSRILEFLIEGASRAHVLHLAERLTSRDTLFPLACKCVP
jgi:hypothetical protein